MTETPTVFTLPTNERWSGGGSVVIRNLLEVPNVTTTGGATKTVTLLARNVPQRISTWTQPFVWLPQNGLAWSKLYKGMTARQMALRAGSQISASLCRGMIRITNSIPPPRPGLPSVLLPNVLDSAFEQDLTDAQMLPSTQAGYFYTAGSAHAYRNIETLIRAHHAYRQQGGSRRLVLRLTGGHPRLVRAWMAEADRGTVEFRYSSVPRSTVLHELSHAQAVILPSEVEASPIIMLEASALNIKVLASRIVPHIELGDGGQQYFSARDSSALARLMHETELTKVEASPLGTPQGRRKARARWIKQVETFLKSITL